MREASSGSGRRSSRAYASPQGFQDSGRAWEREGRGVLAPGVPAPRQTPTYTNISCNTSTTSFCSSRGRLVSAAAPAQDLASQLSPSLLRKVSRGAPLRKTCAPPT